MKFLHTADWQIGMRAAHVGAAGVRVREARLEAARRVIETGREAGVEFVVVCGDTFEDNGVDRVLVQKIVDILAGFGGLVYVIPATMIHSCLGRCGIIQHGDRVRVYTCFAKKIRSTYLAVRSSRVRHKSRTLAKIQRCGFLRVRHGGSRRTGARDG